MGKIFLPSAQIVAANKDFCEEEVKMTANDGERMLLPLTSVHLPHIIHKFQTQGSGARRDRGPERFLLPVVLQCV
jgi:hypothetical protein